MKYSLLYSAQAQKDVKKIKSTNLGEKLRNLLDIIARDPYCKIPPYEKLRGDLEGAYSRRINIQHRLVYSVLTEERIVKILRMWSHYE